MVNVSLLSKRELVAHDLLITLSSSMAKLSPSSRENVYKRWRMLHMLTEQELTNFKSWLERVNDDSGADRREG